MAYRKRTLRSMSPVTREFARLVGELESVSRRLDNLRAKIESLETDSMALHNHSCQQTIATTEELFQTDGGQ